MSNVIITTTSMGFRVAVTRRGEIINSPLNIIEYSRKFEQKQWDPQLRRYNIVNEFFHFDADQQICYFPRFDLDKFKSFLTERSVAYTVIEEVPEEGKHINFLMLPHVGYKNEKQKTCVEYLVDPKNGPLRGVALQTGTGKTVAVILALQMMHRRTMITMTSRLEQWVKEFGSYTNLDEDDIYLIQGVGSLTKLFSLIDTKIIPKIILASTQTIKLYLDYGPTYQHLPHPSEMCEKLGIGIVATDEYHEHFYTNFRIGIILNPALFIPITATFLASDPFVRNIFDQFVPKDVQFVGGEYDKFVNVTAYQYTGGALNIKPFHYMSPRGYSQQMFEKFLLGRGKRVLDNFIEDALIPIIKTHYIGLAQKGERFLFLCSSTKLCDYLETVFKRAFKDKSVSVFYSGMPSTVLERYDMILSTPGSAGTGRDVKNLRTCLVFESVDSETRNRQFIGRLRGPPQMMNTPEFTYVSFSCIPQHQRYANARAMLFGGLAKSFKHRTIS